jgi:hypothetical protein
MTHAASPSLSGSRIGHVFCTEDGKPFDQSNILDRVLHPILVGDENTPGIVVNINGKNFQGVKAGAGPQMCFSLVTKKD